MEDRAVKDVCIIGYGAYLPTNRLKTNLVAEAWGKKGDGVENELGVMEKTVASLDEDSITMAVEASSIAIDRAGIPKEKIGAVFMGSESHPYAVNPSTTTVAEILGLGNNYFTADLEFACKAGTAAVQIVASYVAAGKIDYGLAIGSDKAQARPGDTLEFANGAASAAFILGSNKKESVLDINEFCSYSSDTPDFWRREGAAFPSHGGRFTGEKAYFHHVLSAGKKLFEQTKLKPEDFDYAVFHMPNLKFPVKAGQLLGFTEKQMKPGLISKFVGNSYSACSLVGLSAVLDQAKPNQKIFLVSYGSGAGSDAFSLTTAANILKVQKHPHNLKHFLNRKRYLTYVEYLRLIGGVSG